MNLQQETVSLIHKAIPEAIKALREVVNDETADPKTRVRAASLLRRYAREFPTETDDV